MEPLKEFRTLGADVTAEFEEKKSVFLGHASPVHSEDEALAYLKAKREEYADARHNVYAYLLADGTARCSDDGEPQGTAGIVLLDVLRKNGVTDCILVVTRYFGGILLGAPGLVRAYSMSARLAVEKAGIVTVGTFADFTLTVPYADHRRLKNELDKRGVTVAREEFAENVTLSLSVRAEEFDRVAAFLRECSAGKLQAVKTGEHPGIL